MNITEYKVRDILIAFNAAASFTFASVSCSLFKSVFSL